jgi:hypothetical protein
MWLPSVLFLGFFLPASILGQDTTRVALRGTVLDAVTGQPVQGVIVSMSDLGIQEVTGPEGTFVLTEVPLGPHMLAIQRDGYETRSGRLTVDQGGDMVLRMNPLGGPGPAGMSRIRGTVRDVQGGRPLEGATLRLSGLPLGTATDPEGRFTFQSVPPGEHTLTVELLGYGMREESLALEGGKLLTLDLTLAVEPIEVDPIEVSVEARNLDLELSGFYDRRESTSGLFITRERIEERAPLYTTDLFRGLAGIKVVGGLGMGTQNAVVLAGSRALSFSLVEEEELTGRPTHCYPAVWMDGQMVHRGTAGATDEGPAFLDQLIHPDDIAGIEIYNSPASIPVQYNLFSACGVIVLWTRQGR